MSRMRLSTVLKAAAAIPCLVGFIGYSFTVIAVLFPDEEGCTSGYCPLLWFGGAQPFSLHHLWRSTETSTAADMLALHLPLFSLGPHLCGASGFIFAADGIERRRWWAWAALCLITCIGGINDTSGAYYYYLYTGDLGFLIPLSATIMGAAGLFILTDCLSSNCTQRNPRPPLFSSIYTVGRYFAIIFTSIATICWLYCYLFFFLPAYLVNPGSPSSLLRIDLPAFNNQIPYISEKTDGQARRLHSHLQGFSVMVGQMGWAAGSVGFAITPLIAAVWGLVDCDIAVRRKCLWFLGYTSVLLLTCSYFSTLYVAPFLKTIHGMTCHDIVYSLLLRFYGYSMGASVIVMSISLTDQNCEIPPKNKKK